MSNEHTILIVDNNKGFATMLKQSLEQEGGYRAAVATGGDDALQALTSTSFDLAIVDLGLVGPDGVTVARALRQQKADLRLMLIPITGDELPPDLNDLDIQGILPKPFFLPELPDRIAEALAQPVNVKTAPAAAATATPAPATPPAEAEPNPFVTQLIPADSPAPSAPPPPAPAAANRTDTARAQLPEIVKRMNALAQEINADAVLLSCKGRLISHTGRIPAEGAVGLAQAVAENWRTAARVAQVLGQELQRFEQSTEGGEHMLYSLVVAEDIILSVVLLANVPLGMIRHRTKETADALRTLLNSG